MANLKIVVEAEQRVGNISGESKEFSYTGKAEEYIVPKDGWYYIEMAGASGGYIDSNYYSGLGAKTSGYIELEEGEKLYFYVGGKGSSITTPNSLISGGYNGGGDALTQISDNSSATSGGGATDVRLVGGSWNNTSSLISRIMVAGGGGGSNNIASNIYIGYGGAGGALYGISGESNQGDYYGRGGTQTSGGMNIRDDDSLNGKFGIGGGGTINDNSGAGGGGYYGGASGAGYRSGGGGGSSYISGYAGVNSVEESTTITHTNQTLHYSGKYFIGGSMISNANSGDGYAKIVYVDIKPKKKNTNLNNVRYIKDCSSYNSFSKFNYWSEIQAIVDGVNIAKGKVVIGTTTESSAEPYSRITDGDIDYVYYATPSSASINQCVTVDLGNTYDLDEIAIWQHFRDPRSFYDNVTYVSSNNSTWKEVINEAAIQTSNGRRINAYTDTYNGYAQDGLVLWYDGYANTGHTRSNSSTTWKDLSGTGNDVIVSGATWNRNYLSFDGVDDYAYKTSGAIYNIDKEHTIEVLFQPTRIPTDYQVIFNTTNVGTAVMQYGSLWFNSSQYLSYQNADGYSTRISQGLTLLETDLGRYFLMTNIRDNRDYYVYNKGYFIDDYHRRVSWDARTPNEAIYIGGVSAGKYSFQGKIYSIRVYNRALIEEEVLHNYLYDKQTFNIE